MSQQSKQNITTQTTKKIAFLSRLNSNPNSQFLDKYTDSLNGILDYVQELQSVDTGDISALDPIQTIFLKDLRDDEPNKNQDDYQRVRQNIINNFPKKQQNFLVVNTRVVD